MKLFRAICRKTHWYIFIREDGEFDDALDETGNAQDITKNENEEREKGDKRRGGTRLNSMQDFNVDQRWKSDQRGKGNTVDACGITTVQRLGHR